MDSEVKKKGALREKILETARDLFNRRGYNEVSMRNISDELGISVGNLTYHFKKKEDLVEAVVLEWHKRYQKPRPPKTLEGLNECFRRVLGHQEDNVYYAKHYRQLSQVSERIHQIQNKVLCDLYDIIKEAFSNLRENQMMTAEQITAQIEYLLQTILSLCAYGCVTRETDVLACIWSQIFPLLTEDGQAVFHSKIAPILRSRQNTADAP
ncbi:MAG: TetR/AcrR family transcriptional regulator [Synergistaceae bacterium]|jgi:AcrR family transcriptional regulator|nr:TetR/AcrR family transcriptional regulator [Synergistaceae bacterium]